MKTKTTVCWVIRGCSLRWFVIKPDSRRRNSRILRNTLGLYGFQTCDLSALALKFTPLSFTIINAYIKDLMVSARVLFCVAFVQRIIFAAFCGEMLSSVDHFLRDINRSLWVCGSEPWNKPITLFQSNALHFSSLWSHQTAKPRRVTPHCRSGVNLFVL